MSITEPYIGQVVIATNRDNWIAEVDSMGAHAEGRRYVGLRDNFGFHALAWIEDIEATDLPLPVKLSDAQREALLSIDTGRASWIDATRLRNSLIKKGMIVEAEGYVVVLTDAGRAAVA